MKAPIVYYDQRLANHVADRLREQIRHLGYTGNDTVVVKPGVDYENAPTWELHLHHIIEGQQRTFLFGFAEGVVQERVYQKKQSKLFVAAMYDDQKATVAGYFKTLEQQGIVRSVQDVATWYSGADHILYHLCQGDAYWARLGDEVIITEALVLEAIRVLYPQCIIIKEAPDGRPS